MYVIINDFRKTRLVHNLKMRTIELKNKHPRTHFIIVHFHSLSLLQRRYNIYDESCYKLGDTADHTKAIIIYNNIWYIIYKQCLDHLARTPATI